MVFTSPVFVFYFLLRSLAAYDVSPERWRHVVFTAFSDLFYGRWEACPPSPPSSGCRLSNPVFIQRIVLPVGISFYVFQSLSYCIDLYRGHAPPAKSLGHSACFVVISLGLMLAQGYRPFLHFQC